MQYALIGDIHGNVDALTAVLDAIDGFVPDAIYCLGDIVGYGAAPLECIEITRSREIPSVAGNHDWAATGDISMEYFNPIARASAEWTRSVLTPDAVSYLRELPVQVVTNGMLLTHGSPHNPAAFEYVLTVEQAIAALTGMEETVGFTAHSHIPLTFSLDKNRLSLSVEPQFQVEDGVHALVNVGSVGQPRDNDPRAAFVLYDTETRRAEIRRVPYDIEAAARKIMDARLPDENADRLYAGA